MNISNKGANKDNELYNISVKGSVIEKSDGLKLLGVPPRSDLCESQPEDRCHI